MPNDRPDTTLNWKIAARNTTKKAQLMGLTIQIGRVYFADPVPKSTMTIGMACGQNMKEGDCKNGWTTKLSRKSPL